MTPRPAVSRRIVLATRNPAKVRELASMMRVPTVRWASLDAYPPRRPMREDQMTFRDNAVKKALAVARHTRAWALAYDSGLVVSSLSGEPGIRSARYAGRHGDDHANNRKLLRRLAGKPAKDRRAAFHCVLVLAAPEGVVAVIEGVWRGRIATEGRGRRGFGYDPIFWLPSLRRTSAELSPSMKNRLSHRGRAAARMRQVLRRLTARASVAAGQGAGSGRRARSATAAPRG